MIAGAALGAVFHVRCSNSACARVCAEFDFCPMAENSSNWLTRIVRFLFSGQDETASVILGAGTAIWKLFEYLERIDFLLSIRGEKFAVIYDFFTNVGWVCVIIIAVTWFVIAKVAGDSNNTATGTLRIILACSVVAFLFGVVITISASGAVPNVIAGWGGVPGNCSTMVVTDRLQSFRKDYNIATLCLIVDPRIDPLFDNRVTIELLAEHPERGEFSCAGRVHLAGQGCLVLNGGAAVGG